MSELMVIGYDDEATANKAYEMAEFAGTLLKTSLSQEDEKELAEELAGS